MPHLPIADNDDEILVEWNHNDKMLNVWVRNDGITVFVNDDDALKYMGMDGKALYAWLVGEQKGQTDG